MKPTDALNPTTDYLAQVMSARDQIARDRRCDLRVQCNTLSGRVLVAFCDCLGSAADRVNRTEATDNAR